MRVIDIREIAELDLSEKILFVEDIWESSAADESQCTCASESFGRI